jgi:hypothetical protein
VYEYGHRVPQDCAEAAKSYRKAADQGHDKAQFSLGVLDDQGKGVLRDYVEAHTWFNLASSRASGEDQKKSADMRESVTKKMTAEQTTEAQRRAREWKPKPQGK